MILIMAMPASKNKVPQFMSCFVSYLHIAGRKPGQMRQPA